MPIGEIGGDAMAPVVAIVQARMGSTRLPEKVMKEVCGKPLIAHVVERLGESRKIDRIVIATTRDASDDAIVEWCDENDMDFFRGSTDDVLARYYHAAKDFGANTIVRITSDCPMIDPVLVDAAIERFSTGMFDHVSIDSSFPDGLDAEVFSFFALKYAQREARLASEREHVTPHIWKNPQKFRLSAITSPEDLSYHRWTVDDERDLEFVRRVFAALYPWRGVFHSGDVLRFLKENPEVSLINAGTERNEGYARSLAEDRLVS